MNEQPKKTSGIVKFGIFFFICCFLILSSGKNENNNTNKNNNKNNTEKTTTEKTIDLTEIKEDVFIQDGIKVLLSNLDLDYQSESIFYTLKEDEKFINLSVSYANVSDDDIYVTLYDFKCFADNVACEQVYIDDNDFINDNLSPNRIIKFSISFVVPKEAECLELEYKQTYKDKKTIIKLK